VKEVFATAVIFPETDSGAAVWLIDAGCALPVLEDIAESAATSTRLVRMEKITRRELLIRDTPQCVFLAGIPSAQAGSHTCSKDGWHWQLLASLKIRGLKTRSRD